MRNPSKELMSFVNNQLKKNSDKVWVAKHELQDSGIDMYISSNKFLQSLGKKLKKTFKGELIVSGRLHSRDRQTSKDKYRMTVLFRMHSETPDSQR